MKLPNAELAIVPEQKITLYLLDPTHPVGGSKASFFLRFGFTATECGDWLRLCSVTRVRARLSRRSKPGMGSGTRWTAP